MTALDPADDRSEEMRVAGPAALLVAIAHKIGERLADRDAGRKDRTQPKDAHDVFRLLRCAHWPVASRKASAIRRSSAPRSMRLIGDALDGLP